MGGIGQFFGQLLAPLGNLFHVVFYLPIFNVLMLLYEFVHLAAPAIPAFALAIFLLTIIIRLCLYPLTRKQLQSSRAMQALAPQVQELQRRYKNNPQELMAAQQALYREHGVSMYGGCLPLLIQMPFLYGLYFSLYTALLPSGKSESPAHHLGRVNHDIYPFLPHLAQMPDAHFLWTNLAIPDHTFILPIMAALFTFIQLRMAQPVKKPTPAGQRPDSNTQVMGSMQFVMPFVTLFMALNFPSGLAFYWTISTAFSAVQQYFLTGVGSLFLGIPGLEHLVPAPQATPALPGRAAAASAIVDSTPPSGRPSGISGLRDMLRQLAAPREAERTSTDELAAAQPEPSNGKASTRSAGKQSAGANAATNGTAFQSSQPKTASSDQPDVSGTSTPRRARPTGPVLVKQPQSASTLPPLEAETDRIAVGSAPGAPGARAEAPTPPSPAPRPATRANGNGNGNGNGSAASRANGNGSAASRRPGQPSSRGGNGGGSAARKRSGGKSKGGK